MIDSAPTIDFFYDVVCPYAYLASRRIEAVATRCGATVRWRPVLLGGLLRTVGAPDDPNLVMAEAKARLSRADRHRFAERLGVPLVQPPGHPVRTVVAMRLCLAAQGERRVGVTHALYDAYWGRGDDVADERVLARVATAHGLAADAHRDPALRDGLREATAEAAAAGAFGVPSFVVGGTLWWGQDRLPLVERALGSTAPLVDAPPSGRSCPPTRVRLFHDFSSPFSYLASTQVDEIAAARGLTVEWTPILLGALFREVGTPNVPLLAMNATKQDYVRRDLFDWAAAWGVPFRFPSHFPLRSVLALRVALVEPRATAAIYRAVWADDRRVETPDELGAVLTEAGLPAASVLERAVTPDNKAALRRTTAEAVELGLCGVPSVVVERAGRRVTLWGQDRLPMLAEILDGEWPAHDEPIAS